MGVRKKKKELSSYRQSNSYKKRKRQRRLHIGIFLLSVLLLAAFFQLGKLMLETARKNEDYVKERIQEQSFADGDSQQWEQWKREGAPAIDVELLTPNEYSRPQIELETVKHIAIHYTANPGSGAMDNRNYFENLKDSHETKASSHFIVGLNGEVVQCIPTSEISYATNERNVDTISIECCHWDESGEFSDATYQSAVQLTAWLCNRFEISADDVIRHYDVTGKICPKYYVENPEEWEKMKQDIAKRMEENLKNME